MFRKVFLTIYLSFAVFCVVNCEKDCDDLGTIVYEDIGCKPVKESGKNCPLKYDCGDLSNDNDSCSFRGKSYDVGQQIDNDLTYGSCNVGCFCEKRDEGAAFRCAVLDCPEWLGAPIQPGCYRKYEVDKCCSNGVICPSEEKDLAECTVDGKTFKEGEKFFPKNSCWKCVCDKNWKGKVEKPSCERLSCGTQINHAAELSKKCAPCYSKIVGEKFCCPATWVCPSSSDEIKKINKDADSNSELTCTFGSKTVKLGEGIEREVEIFGKNKNVQCECVLPPLLSCKEV